MKTNSVFVVEGLTDRALLARYFDTEIVVTNGLFVSRETLHYVVGLEKVHDIIIITDPDGPGATIAKKILNVIPHAKRIEIKKSISIKKGKVGLAETNVEQLLPSIYPLLTPPKELPHPLTLTDLLAFQNRHSDFRTMIEKHYPVGKVNNRTLMTRLQYLCVSKEMVEQIIYG